MREQLIAAITERLVHVETTQDPDTLLVPEAIEEVKQLSALVGTNGDDVEALHTLGWFHWYGFLALGETDGEDVLQLAVDDLTWCFVHGVTELPEPVLPLLAENSIRIGAELLTKSAADPDPEVVTATVEVWQRIVDTLPEDHEMRATGLACLGQAKLRRYEVTAQPGDLDEAVTVGYAALAGFSKDDPDHAQCALNLGLALHARYERWGRLEDIDNAVSVCRASVASAPPGHPGRVAFLQGLSLVLRVRSESTRNRDELDESIVLARESLAGAPPGHPDRALVLNVLGTALYLRTEHTGNRYDLDEAVTTTREAAHAAPDGTVVRNMCLTNLCMMLRTRFERTRSLTDLEGAIDAARTALGTPLAQDPYRPLCLVNLCAALDCRFQQLGDIGDVNEAVTAGREAVRSLPADHPDQGLALAALAAALAHRFENRAARTDLDEAISTMRDALAKLPPGSPNRGLYLGILAAALDARSQLTGSDAELNESITVGRDAVRATPEDHPNHAMHQSNLSGSLLIRFERTGALPDLDEAVTTARAAVRTALAENPHRATLSANLGMALVDRYQRMGSTANLVDAVAEHRRAVELTPADHPYRGPYLSTLSTTLRLLFVATEDPALADEAIDVARDALERPLVDQGRHALHLGNLGMALFDRYRHTQPGKTQDLAEAITVLRQAVDATPGGHPRRALHLSNLAVVLANRAHVTRIPSEVDEAVAAMRASAEVESGAPSVRVQSARLAAGMLADEVEAANLFEYAVRLLPTTVPRLLDRSDQQHALGQFAGLAGEAAAAALWARADAATALRLLELGRGVLFSQALDTRSDLTELQERHPVLADRFVRLRDVLDQPDTLDRRMDERNRLAAEFEAVTAEIRGLDGFTDFLLPPDIDRLLRQARQGDVVVVTMGLDRADALLLRPNGISALPLPGLSNDDLLRRVDQFHEAVDLALGGYGGPVAAVAERTLAEVLEWLWDVVAGPVLEELGHTTVVPDPPRVWWSLTGPLGHLPLHAAGYHPTSRTVLDRVISSYTPTVRALDHARTRQAASTANDQALIVAMPSTPGQRPLHHVTEEAQRVARRVPNSTVLIADPTRDSILTRLPDSAIAHFACHGHSTPADPSQSRLLLSDHETRPLTVESLAPIRLEHARLAYLSACRSAFNGATNLMDEAIHLTAAFQLAGYPHVVGTLWEIDDSLAVQVADTFYAQLDTGQGMDTSRAAHALHHAVRELRDLHLGRPSQWAAYVHSGA
ncbi:tetratricopeptide (TPR) repeat protein [Kibdelosporangium banguiense]|uniref:Tetratricopeptide (TPR) repeat protein n=1 Tax=Kibdelosporangium banguiense TaxID=1365924 RepID=A0ABS4TRL4_9PSEU|nr:CHAT domain-containing protein [Kibdelosporangium banguiense]MBP2327046.1 tetratricopeptide (TPR) repeat protein [Kibdelosporangium banguiense]